jgi:hypothetical protein
VTALKAENNGKEKHLPFSEEGLGGQLSSRKGKKSYGIWALSFAV